MPRRGATSLASNSGAGDNESQQSSPTHNDRDMRSDSEESSNSTMSSGSLAEQAVMGAGSVVLPSRPTDAKSALADVPRATRQSNSDDAGVTTSREDTGESSASEDTIARGDWVALVGQDADGGLQAWLARVVSTSHPDNLISLAYFPRVRTGPRAGQHERVWTPEWLEPRDCMSVLPPASVEHLGDKFYKCSVDLSLFLTGVVSQDALQAAEAAAAAEPKPKPRKRSTNKPAGAASGKKRAPTGNKRLTSRQSDMVSAASAHSGSGGGGFAAASPPADSDTDSGGEGGGWAANRALKRSLRRPDTSKASMHPLQLSRGGRTGDAATAAVVGGVMRDVGVSEFAVAPGGAGVAWHTAHRQRQRKGPGGAINSVSMLGGVTNTFDGGAVGGSATTVRRLMLQLKETAANPEAYRNNLLGYAPLEQAGTNMLAQHLLCSATPSTATFRVVPSAARVPTARGSGASHTLLAAGDSSSDDDEWGGGAVDGTHGSPLVRSSIAQGGARGVQDANGDGSAYLPGGAAWAAVQRASAKRGTELVAQGTDKMLRAEQGVPLNVPPPNIPPPPPYQLDVPGGSDKWPHMGVYRDLTANHARWGAEISLNGARYDLGVYACPAEAAAAYDNARLKAEGPVSSTNLGAARLMEGIVPSVFFGAQWAPQEARFVRAVQARLGSLGPQREGTAAHTHGATAADGAVLSGGAGPAVDAEPESLPQTGAGAGDKDTPRSQRKRPRGDSGANKGGAGGSGSPRSNTGTASTASGTKPPSTRTSPRAGQSAAKRAKRASPRASALASAS